MIVMKWQRLSVNCTWERSLLGTGSGSTNLSMDLVLAEIFGKSGIPVTNIIKQPKSREGMNSSIFDLNTEPQNRGIKSWITTTNLMWGIHTPRHTTKAWLISTQNLNSWMINLSWNLHWFKTYIWITLNIIILSCI